MEYRIVLNGFAKNCSHQAEELNGLISRSFSRSDHGATIIFYGEASGKEKAPALSSTADTVLVKVDQYNPETVLRELTKIFAADPGGIYLFPGSFSGNELAVRFSSRTGGCALTGVTRFVLDRGRLYCEKPVYSGRLRGTFEMVKKPWCIAVAPGAAEPLPFPGAPAIAPGPASAADSTPAIAPSPAEKRNIVEIDAEGSPPSFIIRSRFTETENRGSLKTAPFILVAGRGMGDQEQCEILKQTADLLKAEFGSTRPVAMNGWTPMDRMIGISGSITQAALCLTAGVSGSAALMAGIEKSGFIISLNTDPKAPIVGRSDVAVIEDFRIFFPALMKIIEEAQDPGSRKR